MAKRKKTDEDQPNDNDNINESDDAFGLPEIEYEPLARDKSSEPEIEVESSQSTYEPEEVIPPEETSQPSQYTYMQEKEERRSSSAGIIVTIFIILAAVLAWFFLYYKPKKDAAAKLRAEEMAAKQKAEKIEQLRNDSIAAVAAREQWLVDSLANARPSEGGTIEMLSERTGLYRVVIASAIDVDLLTDYAKKLTKKGVSSKIVPPYGDTKFYRLTIAEGDTYSAAQAIADERKSEYGDEVWVLRY